MKNIFTIAIVVSLSQLSIGQINPVQNLQWHQMYDYPYNIFELNWEEPQSPHDEILGYNIYREDEFYRFQTEMWLGFHPEFESNVEEEFLLYNDGAGFIINVSTVYEGGFESEFESVYCEGFMLNSQEQFVTNIQIYPNPVLNKIYFSEKLKNIKIFDSNGKVIFTKEEATSHLSLQMCTTGIYLLTADTVSGKLFKKKFIKR